MLTFEEIKNRVATNPVYQEFLSSLSVSWTWARLTEKERNAFIRLLWRQDVYTKVTDTKETERAELLLMYYDFFLEGCGYDHKTTWREKDRTSRQLKKVVGLAKSLIEAVDELNGDVGTEDQL